MNPSDYPTWRTSWATLDARAWQDLDFSAGLPPSVSAGQPFHGNPRLRITIDPGGCDPDYNPTTLTLYEIYHADSSRQSVVRKAVWHRRADLDRMQAAVNRDHAIVYFLPTIAVCDGTVPTDPLTVLLREANRFRLPIAWEQETESVSSGGWSSRFEFFTHDQPTNSLRLTWSFELPEEWRPVVEWVNRLQEFLTGCLLLGEPGA